MKTIYVVSVNDVIWIENARGDVYGIVSHNKIIDCDGLQCEQNTIDLILSEFDCDIMFNGDDDQTEIYTDCNSKIIFKDGFVTFNDHNDLIKQYNDHFYK